MKTFWKTLEVIDILTEQNIDQKVDDSEEHQRQLISKIQEF